jgi:hypothetical protein
MESSSGTYKIGDPLDENPEIAGLLDAVKKVFKSGTAYYDTLIANIRLSHHAMKRHCESGRAITRRKRTQS